MINTSSVWQAPEKKTLPDFIICGAMKTGTTSLHAMLNQHPDIFIPEKELHFFDCDNPLQHSDFNIFVNGKWQSQALTVVNRANHWSWYQQQFSSAISSQVLGEDSTTYLASPLAAKRIAMQDKKIKLIIMLRQPSNRAYSNYWHLVRSGRASYSFEDTLLLNPNSVLNRSLYLGQIESYLKYFPKEQLKFVIFEEFIKNKQAALKSLCQFIGVDHNQLSSSVEDLHENKTTYPKYYRLQLLKNRLFPHAGNVNYPQRLTSQNAIALQLNIFRYINGLHRKINPLVTTKPMTMATSTQAFLDDYFKNELDGLDELIERDVSSLWFK
ncbi:MAG: sulfotransferase [Colwellia sp.]|nr:sulfotransferase [Colwellia sp.]